jgi:hypothetical protein
MYKLYLFKVYTFFVVKLVREVNMARIIENLEGGRRIIKLSVDDIISIVREYQTIVPRFSREFEVRNYLSDRVIFIPEDI